MDLLSVFFGAAFVNNVVLTRVLGLCPFLGVSKKIDVAQGMALATSFVLTLSCGLTYWIWQFLVLLHLEFLATIFFILVIASLVQFIEIFLKQTSPVLHHVLGVYLPLITTNCAVLGIPIISVREQYSFSEAVFFGFGSAVGFSFILVVFSAIRERLDLLDTPKPFRGVPIALISASLMSLAFSGLGGLIR
jgi:electron transport complex protein RnfA